jgi:hypothetical protein
MRATNLAAMLGAIGLALLAVGGAEAQFWRPWPIWLGNDTGGIIPWSCENEASAPQVAGAYCAQYRKYARITGVTRRYGDYISFNCLWSPSVGRYDLPAVPTRTSCPAEPHLLTK